MIPISINDPAVRVLRTIQQRRYPSAIIAGGAPRDLYLEKSIKDFDIFVQEDSHANDPAFWCDMFNLEYAEHNDWTDVQVLAFMGYKNVLLKTKAKSPPRSSYQHKQHLQQVFDLIIHDVIFQIIIVQMDPKQYVEDWFDFGLCKAWCDGKQFHFSGPFMEDVENRTLTVVQQTMTHKEMEFCLRVRKPRLLGKFPGYRFQVAPHLSDLYTKVYNQVNK